MLLTSSASPLVVDSVVGSTTGCTGVVTAGLKWRSVWSSLAVIGDDVDMMCGHFQAAFIGTKGKSRHQAMVVTRFAGENTTKFPDNLRNDMAAHDELRLTYWAAGTGPSAGVVGGN